MKRSSLLKVFSVVAAATLSGCASNPIERDPSTNKLLVLSPVIGAIPGVEEASRIIYPGVNIINDGERTENEIVDKIILYVKQHRTMDVLQIGSHAGATYLSVGNDHEAAQRVKTAIERVTQNRLNLLEARLDEVKADLDGNEKTLKLAKAKQRQFGDADLYLSEEEDKDWKRANGYMSTHSFLKKLLVAQKEMGIPIAKRIVFAGCAVFTNLSWRDVINYRGIAQYLGADIVGSTSYYAAGIGKMVNFTSDGRVVEEGGLASNNPIAEGFKLVSEAEGYNSDWLACNLGRSLEEAERCVYGKDKPNAPPPNLRRGPPRQPRGPKE